MKHKRFVITSVFITALFASIVIAAQTHPKTDAYPGWRLAVQAYTFNHYTFYEAIDKVASLGLEWIEAYPGQQLSADHPGVKFDHNLPKDLYQQVKDKLNDAGITLVNYGVVGLPNNEGRSRKVFDFAKEFGIETIVSEPPPDAFDLIEKLCEEYKIKVAIHNHPKPSRYWNPDTVLEVCKGRSKWIGACADTGHWVRSGVNPVEALEKLKGRVISFHLKDLNEFGNHDAHDVVWGTGVSGIKAIIDQMNRRKFQGVFSVEYEYHWTTSVPEIRQSITFFNKTASQLESTGWGELIEPDLSNATFSPGGWASEEGIFASKGRGDLWSKEKYGNFILDLEFKMDKETNSGVFIRTGDIEEWLHTGIEIQVYDANADEPHRGDTGAVYDCLAPSKNVAKPVGQWNHLTIIANDNKINVILNNEQIIDMDLNLWTEAHKNPDGSPNKFNTAYKDMPRVGYFGFQDHGADPILYRNIKVKRLN